MYRESRELILGVYHCLHLGSKILKCPFLLLWLLFRVLLPATLPVLLPVAHLGTTSKRKGYNYAFPLRNKLSAEDRSFTKAFKDSEFTVTFDVIPSVGLWPIRSPFKLNNVDEAKQRARAHAEPNWRPLRPLCNHYRKFSIKGTPPFHDCQHTLKKKTIGKFYSECPNNTLIFKLWV